MASLKGLFARMSTVLAKAVCKKCVVQKDSAWMIGEGPDGEKVATYYVATTG